MNVEPRNDTRETLAIGEITVFVEVDVYCRSALVFWESSFICQGIHPLSERSYAFSFHNIRIM